ELAITEGSLTSTENTLEFPAGGGGDPYLQDSVLAGTIPVNVERTVDLAENVRSWFKQTKSLEKLQKPAIKVVPPNGATVAWIGAETQKSYSISCAYDAQARGNATYLYFWGDVWEDDQVYSEIEGEAKRRIISLAKPEERSYPLPVTQMKRLTKEYGGEIN